MKILFQLCILFSICLLSELFCLAVPVGIPAGIVSMLILFILLISGIIRMSAIKECSEFLLKNMAVFFIPAGVNILSYLDILKENLFPLLIICFLSTIITFMTTAFTVTAVSRFFQRSAHE